MIMLLNEEETTLNAINNTFEETDEDTESFNIYITLSHDASLAEEEVLDTVAEQYAEPETAIKTDRFSFEYLICFRINLPIGRHTSEEIGDDLWDRLTGNMNMISMIIININDACIFSKDLNE